uniref:Protein Flattop n=1 Tax=Knipowitschia caucasica TaxID=637954 RepID=A0AAV2M0U5_KNICA
MSSGFSANQFDGAFKSQRLQNWGPPKQFKERPTAKLGQTSIIVDDRGHLLPGFKMRDSSWPDFKGTWDLPARLPAHSVCPTARSEQGLRRLRAWGVTTPRITDPPAESSTDTQAQDASTQQVGDVWKMTCLDTCRL